MCILKYMAVGKISLEMVLLSGMQEIEINLVSMTYVWIKWMKHWILILEFILLTQLNIFSDSIL